VKSKALLIECLFNLKERDKMAKVEMHVPNKGYNGIYGGVRFHGGVGVFNDVEVAKELADRYGYEIVEIEPEAKPKAKKAKAEPKEEKPKAPKKRATRKKVEPKDGE
jgi:hypothetical protein